MKQVLAIVFIVSTIGFQCCNAQQQGNSQAHQKEITETFEKYISATKSENIEDQLEYYYPRTFEFFPRDSFIVAFEMMQEMPDVKMGNEKMISLSEVYTDNNFKYALLTFSQEMSFDMSEKIKEGGMDYAIALGVAEYKRQLGEENVNYDEERHIIELFITHELYWILDPEIKDWKFVLKDETSIDAIEQIIPEKIRQKL
jgi:hypothetical protein